MQTSQPGGWIGTVLPIVIIVAVFAYRMRSMSKVRPLKVKTMWIVPTFLLVMAALVFATMPPPMPGWALIAVGLALGALVGWYRGKMIAISRDPETGALTQQASPLALLLIGAVVILKMGAKEYFGPGAATQPGGAAMLLTDAFLGFGIGLLAATRFEMYIRVRRIMAGAAGE